ncbi:MAG TPA: SAM-dependent methyltransferase [Candidatus Dormibacteraeota bacterium]|nr:SAM-dependent methyltransferase [Candidatus Dormibacteraeota bacterium]
MTGTRGRDNATLELAYFESLYAANPDPWGFETRWYERRKHALTVASLPRPRYQRVFEPACSNGRLSSLLAPRCASLLAVDAVGAAVERAQRRLANQTHVKVEQRQLPAEWPGGTFDLIVVSEFLYYLDGDDLGAVIERILAALELEGTLVAVHWRHPVAGYPLTGDAVHRSLRSTPGLALLASHREEDFLIDVLQRAGGAAKGESVAQATGVPGTTDRS